MKKIFLSALLIVVAVACNDDDKPVDNSYPTDGLSLPETKQALLIHSYNPLAGYTSQIPSLILEDAFPDAFNYLSTVAIPNTPLTSGLTDSIALNQPLEPAISFYLNDKTVDPGMLYSETELAVARRPVASVNHVITSNDTAWLIDSKIKFFKDTSNSGFRVETYLTADIQAAVFPNGLDLRVSAAPNFVITKDTASVWDVDLNNIDSSATLTTKGDAFYHKHVLAKNFNTESAWGTLLGEYTPFGESFSENDVIGTSSTPIRHYYLKPDLGFADAFDPGLPYNPGFLTVIWCFNQNTGRYDYVNSVFTSLD